MPSELEIEEIRNLLSRHRTQIGNDITDAHLLGVLLKKDVLNISEEESINTFSTIDEKCDKLIEIISLNGYDKFQEFCYSIESEFTKLITDLINDGLNCSKFYYPLFVFYAIHNGLVSHAFLLYKVVNL